MRLPCPQGHCKVHMDFPGKLIIGKKTDQSHWRHLVFCSSLQCFFIFSLTPFHYFCRTTKFDMAIHAYQRMSEGAFKHLLTVLLFCERLIEGANPNYDRISRTGFGPKVKRYEPSRPKSIADSSEPLIAGLADDLVMYVRHADAHCDFRPQSAKELIVLELAYKLLTEYADPPDLFNIEMTKDEIYYRCFLKPVVNYLSHILVDCYNIVSYEVTPTFEQIKALNQEVTVLQNILVTNKVSGAIYHSYHTLMVQATRIVKQFVRAQQLSVRSKGSKRSGNPKAILDNAKPLIIKLLDFETSVERKIGEKTILRLKISYETPPPKKPASSEEKSTDGHSFHRFKPFIRDHL